VIDDPLIYVRAVHFAAAIMAAGVVFFVVFIAEPAFRCAPDQARIAVTLRSQLAWIGWVSIILAVLSGAAWLILTATSMSGQAVAEVLSQGVLWTVLSQTDFGNDWLARFVLACALAGVLTRLPSAQGAKSARLKAAAVIAAAAFVGTLAFAGHALGGQGTEGIVHPAADLLHLIAAAAWLGGLVPLALLLSRTGEDGHALAVARAATSRFSTLGIVSVATLLFTGIVNSWYLVGSLPALKETDYGRLLLIKIALFATMVGIAALNWSRLTPRLIQNVDITAAQKARRQLRRNSAIEAFIGAVIIGIVAVLGTLPPASHAHNHGIEEAIPADASFQHIHSEHGMADVMIEPGRVGTARVTIHLLDDDLEKLAARDVALTLTAPTRVGKPITRPALQDPDGKWRVDGIALSEPGNWTVTVDALLSSNRRLVLTAPIVIHAK
jgi:putative copper resistance protein D